MSKWIAASTVFLAFLLFAGAQDNPKKDPSPTGVSDAKSFSEKMEALCEEFRAKEHRVSNRLASSKNRRTQHSLRKAIDKLEERYSARYLDLAERNPKEPEVLTVLQQVAQSSEAHAGRAVDILIRQHADSRQIGEICYRLANDGENPAHIEKLARAVLQKNRSDDVVATTSLALARVLLARCDSEKIEPAERTRLIKEAETVLTTVMDKYPKVTVTAAAAAVEKLATPALFEIRHLQPGMRVPPLKAEDIDGKPIDLADYRGKVVLLQFWQFG